MNFFTAVWWIKTSHSNPSVLVLCSSMYGTQCKFLLHWDVHMRYKSYTRPVRFTCHGNPHKSIKTQRTFITGKLKVMEIQHVYFNNAPCHARKSLLLSFQFTISFPNSDRDSQHCYGSHGGSLFAQESSSTHRISCGNELKSCVSNLIPVQKSEPPSLP